MKSKLCFGIILLIQLLSTPERTFAQAPEWAWAKTVDGCEFSESFSVATDAEENIYVTGDYYGDFITFDSVTLLNVGLYDAFLTKYDAAGNVIWARNAGGSDDDESVAVATDASGNVYVAGRFRHSNINFDGITLFNAGEYDMFIAKYDSSGNIIWARNAGQEGWDKAFCMTTDNAGNVYVGGYFESPTITFGSAILINTGNRDMFLAKYDASGNTLWATSATGMYDEYANSLVADSDGNIYLAGFYNGSSVTFGTTVLTGEGPDAFLVKYDSAGNVLWARDAGGSGEDIAYSVAIDNAGDIYVTGSFNSPSIVFGPTILNNEGALDIFLFKYENSGDEIWARSAGGIDNDEAYSVDADASGIYLTGYFVSASISFDSTLLTGAGWDLLVAKYQTDGSVSFALSAGGTDIDWAYSVAIDDPGAVYAAGDYRSTSISFGSTTLINSSDGMMFLARLDTAFFTGSNLIENFSCSISLNPNPLSQAAVISFSLSQSENVSLQIFDLQGRLIRTLADEVKSAGRHKLTWDTRDENSNAVSAGVYLLQFQSSDFLQTQKLMVTR